MIKNYLLITFRSLMKQAVYFDQRFWNGYCHCLLHYGLSESGI